MLRRILPLIPHVSKLVVTRTIKVNERNPYYILSSFFRPSIPLAHFHTSSPEFVQKEPPHSEDATAECKHEELPVQNTSASFALNPNIGIAFTCKVCSTRNIKSFSRRAYEHGVVIIRCTGCQNLHLIADHLGWFAHVQGRNIEEILKLKGEEVKRLSSELAIDE